MKIYVPGDSAAISVGADDVAAAIAQKVSGATIVRNGSRGALWLEPMVEVETDEGRVAYGPVNVEDIDSLIAADFMHGGAHKLSLGEREKIEWLASQDRVTFKRVGIIDPLSGSLRHRVRARGATRRGPPDAAARSSWCKTGFQTWINFRRAPGRSGCHDE